MKHYTREEDYPVWCCIDCGREAFIRTYKKPMREGGVATFHEGECGSCHKVTSVTEPRDYGYPDFRLLDTTE